MTGFLLQGFMWSSAVFLAAIVSLFNFLCQLYAVFGF